MHFVDSLGPAFLGLQLYRLLDVIDSQGTDVLNQAAFPYPSRIASTYAVLIKDGPSSLTQIGKRLGMPHQLVAQRAKLMRDLGLVEYEPDPTDGRRTFLKLTVKGSSEAKKLTMTFERVSEIYADIFEEIGTDLFTAILDFRKALENTSLADRLANAAPPQSTALSHNS